MTLAKVCPAQDPPITPTGLSWHDFVDDSQTPGACSGETEASSECTFLGYNVEEDPKRIAGCNSARMVYRCEMVQYHHNLTSVQYPNSCPVYEDVLSLCFNKKDCIIVTCLIDPPTGTHTRWILDKDEIIPYQEQGSLNMSHRMTYICEGPWYTVDWNSSVESVGGTGFVVTATTDPDEWMWDNATIMNQTKPPTSRYSSAPLDWFKNPTTAPTADNYDIGASKQKIMKCQIRKSISDITAIISPTCEIPVNFTFDYVKAFNNGENELEIQVPYEASIDSRRFRINGESITPSDLRGGKMMQYTKEFTYMCDPILYSTVYV